jgi:ADP-heptose:LPS heptosyltransferase
MKFIKIAKEGLILEQGTPWAKELKPEKYYLVSDLIHQQFSYIMPDHIYKNVIDIDEVYRPYQNQDLNGKSLLVWRHGGIGDLMFMMPPLRLLKVKYPKSKLMVGLGGKYVDIYKEVPYIDEIHRMPFDIETLELADYHLHFEQIIEGNPLAERANAYDLFLNKFGFNPNEIPAKEKLPDIFLTELEMNFAKEFLDRFKIRENDILVGIQVAPSSPIRAFPEDKMIKTIRLIASEPNGKVILFGSPAQGELAESAVKSLPEDSQGNVINTIKEKFTLRRTMSVTRHCDLIIAPDSAMIHIAGALRVPVLGLYGPFPADLRMRYYYNALALNALPSCAPCFIHDHDPCAKGSPSPCFSLVDMHHIMFSIEYLLNKTLNKSIESVKKQKKSIFNQVIEKAKPYMKGNGLDAGCGFQKYPSESSIIRLDVNPLVDPDVVDNFFSYEHKGEDKLDFIISSYMLCTAGDLLSFMEKADKMLKVEGHIILFIGDNQVLKKAVKIKTLSSHLLEYLNSELTNDIILSHISTLSNYKVLEIDLPPPVDLEKEALEIFGTRHGIFIVMRKKHETEKLFVDKLGKTTEEDGAEAQGIEKPE